MTLSGAGVAGRDRTVDTGEVDSAAVVRTIRRAVTRALAEDLDVDGDVTSLATLSALQWVEAEIVARQPGIVAGIDCVRETFAQVDARVEVQVFAPDGADVVADEVIAVVVGPVRSVLAGERTALNFLGHLSGIASATAAVVRMVEGTGVHIRDTRKTTPGLRLLEKAAVAAGGGHNHRIGLYDALLVKDNHVAGAGSLRSAVLHAQRRAGGRHVQVEVTTLDELQEAVDAGAQDILLDNFTVAEVARAVTIARDHARLEASGNLNARTVRAYAEALGPGGRLAIGAITHSAPSLDVALDVVRTADHPSALRDEDAGSSVEEPVAADGPAAPTPTAAED